MRSAPTTIECAKWSQTDPCAPDPKSSIFQPNLDERKGPFLLTSDYVCDGCKHPRVTNEMFIQKLGLAAKKEDFSERTWRRYVNAEQPMPVDQYRRVVANAFVEGWLGKWQAITEWLRIKELEAARSSLVGVVRRASERKAFRQHQKLDVSAEEIEDEFAKQLRLLDYEARRSLNQHLKDETLPPELREVFKEVIVEAMAGTHPKA